MLTGGLLAGSVFTPLLLPWLPGRAFAAKGAVAGLITGCIVIFLARGTPGTTAIQAEAAGMLLISVALAAYLAMNFTGASDYTSSTGVRGSAGRYGPVAFGFSGPDDDNRGARP